jgi:hypothetical protein
MNGRTRIDGTVGAVMGRLGVCEGAAEPVASGTEGVEL